MATTLQMTFTTEQGKSVTISVPDPKAALTPAEVEAAMQTIIDMNVFTTSSGSLVGIKEANMVARDVTPIIE